jgi:hypothetical protein
MSVPFLTGAFVPIAIVSLWIVLAAEPGNGWFHRHVLSWSSDLHISGLVNDLKEYVPLFAFGIGLVFGYSFDTTGPRREAIAPTTPTRRRGLRGRRRPAVTAADTADADAPVTRERVAAERDVPVDERDRVTTK